MILNIKKDFLFIINDSYIKNCYYNKKSLAYFKKKRLLKYVNNAPLLLGFLDLTDCLFSGKDIPSYETLFTDGEWIWSADLNYYSKNFYFEWPNEFIKSIANKCYKLPKLSDDELENIYDILAKKHSDFYPTNYVLTDDDLEVLTKKCPPMPEE